MPKAKIPAGRSQNPKKEVSREVVLAIRSMDNDTLRRLVLKECETNEAWSRKIAHGYDRTPMVPGKDVVRYHRDSESEDDKDSELDSDGEFQGRLLPIGVKDDEHVPRWAVCERCKERFDITKKERKCIMWHPVTQVMFTPEMLFDFPKTNLFLGEKEESMQETFEDEVEFEWSCCEKDGEEFGCKYTLHKAAVNQIVREEVKEGAKDVGDMPEANE